jgi:hypothetical protein
MFDYAKGGLDEWMSFDRYNTQCDVWMFPHLIWWHQWSTPLPPRVAKKKSNKPTPNKQSTLTSTPKSTPGFAAKLSTLPTSHFTTPTHPSKLTPVKRSIPITPLKFDDSSSDDDLIESTPTKSDSKAPVQPVIAIESAPQQTNLPAPPKSIQSPPKPITTAQPTQPAKFPARQRKQYDNGDGSIRINHIYDIDTVYFAADHQFRKILPSGSHRVTLVEYNATGDTLKVKIGTNTLQITFKRFFIEVNGCKGEGTQTSISPN